MNIVQIRRRSDSVEVLDMIAQPPFVTQNHVQCNVTVCR